MYRALDLASRVESNVLRALKLQGHYHFADLARRPIGFRRERKGATVSSSSDPGTEHVTHATLIATGM
jgi:hypothetical protein